LIAGAGWKQHPAVADRFNFALPIRRMSSGVMIRRCHPFVAMP